MKRVFFILFVGQVLVASLYLIHLKRLKLNEGYKIGRLVEAKHEKLIELDKEIYLVEKLKNPHNLMQRMVKLDLSERPGDQEYFKQVYLNPKDRKEKVKEFHEKQTQIWKDRLAEREQWFELED